MRSSGNYLEISGESWHAPDVEHSDEASLEVLPSIRHRFPDLAALDGAADWETQRRAREILQENFREEQSPANQSQLD